MDEDNVEYRYAKDVDQEVKLAPFRTITAVTLDAILTTRSDDIRMTAPHRGSRNYLSY